jgi:hypothetical protein
MISTALAVLTCVLPYGSAQHSDRALSDEMAFARELAVRYQYMDLAERVLGDLGKQRLDEKQKERLALVQSQVFTEGAKREGDPKKRLETFEKAAQSYRDFFASHPFSEVLPEAERSYLGLVNNYGRALELALADAVGEESEALRETIKKVLDEGLERTSSLKDAYDRPNLSPAEKLEKWRLMLDRAQMLIIHGNVTPNPELDYSLAERELEKVAQEATETSAPGLNAFLALAKLNRSRGRYGEAADFAEFVVVTSVPAERDNDEWKSLPLEARSERFKLVELALPELVQSLSEAGRMAQACKWALYYFNAWKSEGVTLTAFGRLAQLAAARTLLEAGGWVGGSLAQGNLRWFETEEEFRAANYSARDSRTALELALQSAQEVNTEMKGTNLQPKAQKLISDVISRPGVNVPPDVLFEAALGEFNSQNYVAAVDSLKGVIRALDVQDEATRREYMPKVLNQLGLAFAKQSRPLEAAMAFRDGATTWKGDPEFQPKLAQGFYREIGNVRRSAPGDKLVDDLFLYGEKLVKESDTGTGADVIRWREAERFFGQGNFDAARKSYLTVGVVADEHEKAIAKAALCLYKLNDKEGAKKEFRQYVEAFVTNPQNAITGARKLAAREEAKAQAVYYLGKMAYDAQDWDEALAVLAGYEKKFATQTEYAPNALYMVTLAHIAKKDLAAARASVSTMRSVFETSAATGKAALNLYQALKVDQEAAAKAGDEARAAALKREMAENMRLSNDTGQEPNFSGLRTESSLWLELGEWVSAEQALRATLKAFEGKADRAADIERFVQPDLGKALLGQRRVPEAFAVLDPLIPKTDGDPRKPASLVVRDWARAVGGWVEGEAEIVEVPGVGGDFARANELLDKLLQAERTTNEAWSCPWYRLKFDQIYNLWQWSKADSSQKGKAKAILDDIASQLGDPELRDLATKCGGEELRKRFLWLRNQLR